MAINKKMEKQVMSYSFIKILLKGKRDKQPILGTIQMNLKILLQEKEAQNQEIHTVCFHLY